MKEFFFHSAINPLSARSSLIEFKGHRIPLPAASSHEPMLRGCDQREWLDKLVKMGLRHLIVPLNGPEEDTCVFARRHPRWALEARESGELQATQVVDDPLHPLPPKKKKSHTRDVLYDLEHRDEGFFSRLQFLLSAADSIGVVIGFSLFSGWPTPSAGPFRRVANIQGLAIDDAVNEKSANFKKIEAALNNCVDWLAAEIRGRPAVWVQIFRGVNDELPLAPLSSMENSLARRMANALARLGEDERKARQGPWLVPPPGFELKVPDAVHMAPFGLRREAFPEESSRPAFFKGGRNFDNPSFVGAERVSSTASRVNLPRVSASLSIKRGGQGVSSPELEAVYVDFTRRPLLCQYAMSDVDERTKGRRRLTQNMVWRSALNGAWPTVPGGFERRESRRWFYLSQMAAFYQQWAGDGYLRPCPEILQPSPVVFRSGSAVAASDGRGKYFIYFESLPGSGLELDILPGCYRYYWLDPTIGRAIDRGEGLEGGRCRVPEIQAEYPAILILEQEELPDPLSVW
jgi:hypothetical protein